MTLSVLDERALGTDGVSEWCVYDDNVDSPMAEGLEADGPGVWDV